MAIGSNPIGSTPIGASGGGSAPPAEAASGYSIPDLRLQNPELYYPRRKPVGRSELDTSNPLVGGLVGYWLWDSPDGLPVNMVKGGVKCVHVGSGTGNKERDHTLIGLTGGVDSKTFQPFLGTEDDYVWFIDFKLLTPAGGSSVIMGNRYEGTSSPLQFMKIMVANVQYYNVGYPSISYSNFSIGTRYTFILAKVGNTLTAYINGVQVDTATVTKTEDANPVYFGTGGIGGEEPTHLNVYSAFHGRMRVDATKSIALYRNPYQFLKPALKPYLTIGIPAGSIEPEAVAGYFLPDLRLQSPELYYPRRKPIGAVEIDWSNPLTKGLKFYALFGKEGVFFEELVQDYVVNDFHVGALSGVDINGTYVKAVDPASTLGTPIRPVSIDTPTQGVSLVTDIKQNTVISTQFGNPLVIALVEDQTHFFGIYHDWRSPDTGVTYRDGLSSWNAIEFGLVSTGDRVKISSSLNPNMTNNLFFDGKLVKTESNSSSTKANTFDYIIVGTKPNDADSDADTSVYMFAVYEGELPDNELTALSRNPYQILRPKKPPVQIRFVDAPLSGFFVPNSRLEKPSFYYRNRKPVTPVSFSREHPLARNMRFLILMNTSTDKLWDYVREELIQNNNDPVTLEYTKEGAGMYVSSFSDNTICSLGNNARVDLVDTEDWTVTFRCHNTKINDSFKSTIAGNFAAGIQFDKDSGGTTSLKVISAEGTTLSFTLLESSHITASNNYSIVHHDPLNTYKLYINGKLIQSIVYEPTFTLRQNYIFSEGQSSNALTFNGYIYYYSTQKAALSAGEIWSLHNDLYQIFEPV